MNCTLYAGSNRFPSHCRERARPFGTGFEMTLPTRPINAAANRKENVMRRILSVSLLSLSLVGVPALVGCDRTVAHQHSEDVKPDGSSVSKDTKVTKNADGSVTKTETKDVNK